MGTTYTRGELARLLEIKPEHVNRLQHMGIINPERNQYGYFIYTKQCLRDAEDYFLMVPKANANWKPLTRVAELFGIAPTTIHGYIKAGKVRSQKSWLNERLVNVQDIQEVLVGKERAKSDKRIAIIEHKPEKPKPEPENRPPVKSTVPSLESLRQQKRALEEKLEVARMLVEIHEMRKQLSELEKGLD
ncbi:MAG: hypothetical protein SPK50_03050 [Mobiluncus porci]|uniref:hypothetical protein n=1 Tax=Mobiluncus porci TaxID=2652278 RepID=UPI0023F0FCF5|nr:hypothetical protein [Mobiluncus porci]MDD7541206.1 hypothetical protein [Mobiluncus porci]MDY5748095.1 hypothetical protein [Mobiluncus porci]